MWINHKPSPPITAITDKDEITWINNSSSSPILDEDQITWINSGSFPPISNDAGIGLQSKLLGNITAACLTVISMYILLALVVYQRHCANTCSLIATLHIVTALSSFLSLLAEQLELQWGDKADIFCQFYLKLVACFYFIGNLSSFTLIWFRQKSLYSDPLLKPYYGKNWIFVSNFIIVGIYVVIVPACVLYIIYLKLKSTKHGCIIEIINNNALTTSIIVIALVICAVFFQFALLLLMIYPLQKSGKSIKKFETNNNQQHDEKIVFTNQQYNVKQKPSTAMKTESKSTIRNVEEENHSKQNQSKSPTFHTVFSQYPKNMEKEVVMLIRRLILCSGVCITSEICAAFIAAISLLLIPDSYWSLVIHVDLIVNTLAITFSFVNWRERLFPFVNQ